ncbi:MAG: ABC transporter permease [Spirochaetales bacterium]|nr:ABC transporter permease [Spirochaetales bacterium]MCF7937412.1 ABC transporter permease [Spirochaetales bacterium]
MPDDLNQQQPAQQNSPPGQGNAAAAPPVSRELKQSGLNLWINRFGVYVVAILFILVGIILFGGSFFNSKNFLNILDAVTLLGMAAVGVAFVTYSGHFADLSIPTTMALSGYIAIELIPLGMFMSIFTGLLVGVGVGLVNAFAVGKLRANPIIWTLAMAYVTKGVVRWVWLNKQIYPDIKAGIGNEHLADAFINLYRIRIFGSISITVIILIALVIAAQFLLKRTKFGQQLKVTGSSYDVARLSGIKASRVVGTAFLISSLTAALTGIFITSLGKVGAYYNGEGYDFNAVTAVVIGGMTLNGGRGDIIGVLGGVFVIGLMRNIMTLMGIDTFSQTVVQGIVFITVVYINARSLRKLGRDDA